MGRAVQRGGWRIARFGAVAALSLGLAHCSKVAKVDPRYGVAPSEKVVADGDAVPKGGGTYRVGRPYQVAGRTYTPEENTSYSAEGLASWYGGDFHGRRTANGETFDMHGISAAHPTLPMPSYVRVTNLRNSRSIIVRVNDRGPYHQGRVIDVSVRTAQLLGFHDNGVARVRVDYVGRAALEGSDDIKLAATLRQGNTPLPASTLTPEPVMVASAKPFWQGFFGSRPAAQAQPAAEPEPSRAVKRAPAATEVAARTPTTPPAGPTLASARSVPAPAPAARGATETPASFDSRFGSAASAPVGGSPPVSAYAPYAPVVSGRGLY
jgi:rare lipoprotein A